MAHAVARVAATTVRAVGAQRALEGEAGDELTRELMRTLAELDAERAANDGGQGPGANALPLGHAKPDDHL